MSGLRFKTSYRQIWHIAYPIMISGIAQNAINVTDTAFMGRVGEVELGAVGLGGVFYFTLIMLTFGIGTGIQIIVARRAGEDALEAIGRVFQHGVWLLMWLSLALYVLTHLFSAHIFPHLLRSEDVHAATHTYLSFRSHGIFFAAMNIAFRGLYVGIGRTEVITWSTFVLAGVNVFFDYALIFGNFGMPEMGIAGAAIASVVAECSALVFLLAYTRYGLPLRVFALAQWHRLDKSLFRRITILSAPLVLQYLMALGGWFLFFVIIEQMGERELAVSNIIRSVYMLLMIPVWGFATAANALVSNVLGQQKPEEVKAVIWKTVKFSVAMMAAIACLSALFPGLILKLYTNHAALIEASHPLLYLVLVTLLVFSAATIYFNALAGTGDTRYTMFIETVTILVYLGFAFVMAVPAGKGLLWVWSSELIYWTLIGLWSWLRLRGGVWKEAKV